MVNQTNKIVREIDKLSENETAAVLEYISQLLARRYPAAADSQTNDDLIMTLAENRENARARQVVEWEKIRRRNAPRAA